MTGHYESNKYIMLQQTGTFANMRSHHSHCIPLNKVDLQDQPWKAFYCFSNDMKTLEHSSLPFSGITKDRESNQYIG